MKQLRPWLQRADWKAGVIHSTRGMPSKGTYIGLVAGALMLAIMGFVGREDHRFQIWLVIMGLAGIAQIGFLVLRARRSRARYDDATFEFEKVPFILGQKLRGTIKARFPSRPGDYTRAILRCTSVYYNPNDPSESIFETRKQWIPMHLVWVGDEVHLPFEVELPEDAPATGGTVQWVLLLTCDFPRLHYRAEFQLPIYGLDAAPIVQETGLVRVRKFGIRRAMAVFDDQP
jgi:hypothetical protein